MNRAVANKSGASKGPGPRNRSGYSLAIILLLATAIRFIELGRESFWYDELYSAWVRKLPLTGLVPEVLAAGHPPLFNVIGHFWNYFGESDFQVRALSASCGVVTVWLVYLLGKELFTRSTALWAAALASLSPFLVWYSREATSYSWLVMITTLSFLMLARCAQRGGWKNWAGYILATTTAFFTHFFAIILLIPGFTIYWLLRDSGKSRLKPWLISQTILVVTLGGSLSLKHFVVVYSESTFFPGLSGLAHGLAAAPLSLAGGRVGYAMSAGTSMLGLSKRGWMALAAGLLLVAAILCVKGVRRQLRSRNAMALIFYILLLVAAPVAMVSSLPGTPVAARYYVWAAPALALLISVILTALPRRSGVAAMTLAMAAFLGITLWGYGNENYDWRDAMRQVADGWQADDRVVCYPIHHCIVAASHYLPPGTDMVGGNLDNEKPGSAYYVSPGQEWAGYGHRTDYSLLSGSELVSRVTGDASGAGRIWLVAGDGMAGEYPSAGYELAILENQGWKEAGRRHFVPLVVILLVR